METASIINIKNSRDTLKEKLSSIDKNRFGNQLYGSESEYNYKGLIGEIDSLMTDISALIKAPNQFLKLSTHQERQQINNSIYNIATYIDQPQNLFPQIETLKTQLRPFLIRTSKDRCIEFDLELDKMVQKKMEFEDELKKLKNKINDSISTSGQIDEIHSQSSTQKDEFLKRINELEKIKQNLIEESEDLNNINIDLKEISANAKEKLNGIIEFYTESKTNEKIITSFAQKIQDREKRLDEIQSDTQEYKESLKKYQEERTKILDESSSLIESAKQALGYKTSEGISAAFQTHHESIQNSKYWIWLIGSGISLLLTIGLGIWIMLENDSALAIMIGRIALMPLPIASVFFCANQYVKQKNIEEDYAYKMVLAKAMVGFSEQIKKHGSESNEEYMIYMKKVLEEIHKDPQRKRQTNSIQLKKEESFDTVEKIMGVVDKMSKIGKVEN